MVPMRCYVLRRVFRRRHLMKRMTSLLFGVAMVAGIVAALAQISTGTDVKSAPQSARDIRGASPYLEIEKEPAPKLIVDAPLPEGLAHPAGVFWAQYRVENVHILPVFGEGALKASPRIGHLHITVDDLPWWWADASDNKPSISPGCRPASTR